MTISSNSQPILVLHADDQAVERWTDPGRGSASWCTLFSHGLTGTTALSSGVCDLALGAQLAPHRHSTVETYYVLQGDGILTLGDGLHTITAGSSALIPSLTVHGLLNTGPSTLRFFYAFAADAFTDVEYDFDVSDAAPPTFR